MTKNEVEKLFLLLKQFYPKKKHDTNFTLAWEMALKPYAYDDVKEAALEHARTNRFFPDIYEIVSYLKKPEDEPQTTSQDGHDYDWMIPYIDRLEKACENKPICPVTKYAGEYEIGTIGDAQRELGMTWQQAKEWGVTWEQVKEIKDYADAHDISFLDAKDAMGVTWGPKGMNEHEGTH